MKTLPAIATLVGLLCAVQVRAQILVTVSQGEESDLPVTFDATDLLQGLIPEELIGDHGWHPVNTDPADQLAAFTDGQGVRSTGFTGLLNDFPGVSLPTKRIEYTLPKPADINEIRVFSGNELNRDGRVFHTYTVRFSSDGGQTYTEPIYVQSHLSGTINSPQNNAWRVVLSQLTDASGPLARGVNRIQFDFYAVDNTQGEMRDAFDGINPFTEVDDFLSPAFESPLVWEIDVLGTESALRLEATLAGPELLLSWMSPATNIVIQAATKLDPPDWADLSPQPVVVMDGLNQNTSVPRGSEPRYFRLRMEAP